MADFGVSAGSNAISSQLHFVHTKSHHIKGTMELSLMKATAPSFQKRPHMPPPFMYNIKLPYLTSIKSYVHLKIVEYNI